MGENSGDEKLQGFVIRVSRLFSEILSFTQHSLRQFEHLNIELSIVFTYNPASPTVTNSTIVEGGGDNFSHALKYPVKRLQLQNSPSIIPANPNNRILPRCLFTNLISPEINFLEIAIKTANIMHAVMNIYINSSILIYDRSGFD